MFQSDGGSFEFWKKAGPDDSVLQECVSTGMCILRGVLLDLGRTTAQTEAEDSRAEFTEAGWPAR